jgi:hypothetical protein
MGHPLVRWLGWSSRKHFHERTAEQQVPPLRYAPVGMTLLLFISNCQRHLFEGLDCALAQQLFGSLDEAAIGSYG